MLSENTEPSSCIAKKQMEKQLNLPEQVLQSLQASLSDTSLQGNETHPNNVSQQMVHDSVPVKLRENMLSNEPQPRSSRYSPTPVNEWRNVTTTRNSHLSIPKFHEPQFPFHYDNTQITNQTHALKGVSMATIPQPAVWYSASNSSLSFLGEHEMPRHRESHETHWPTFSTSQPGRQDVIMPLHLCSPPEMPRITESVLPWI